MPAVHGCSPQHQQVSGEPEGGQLEASLAPSTVLMWLCSVTRVLIISDVAMLESTKNATETKLHLFEDDIP